METLPDKLYEAIVSYMDNGDNAMEEEIFEGDNQEYFQLIKDLI